MAKTTSRKPGKQRLAQRHHTTAWELAWIDEPSKDMPLPDRGVLQKATLYLNRLAKEAGIDRTGLRYRQSYLEAVRALVRKTGTDDSPSARKLQTIAHDWVQYCRRKANKPAHAEAEDRETQATAPVTATQGRVEELRAKLVDLYLPECEAARFRVLREIYDLEHAGEVEDWPEIINA